MRALTPRFLNAGVTGNAGQAFLLPCLLALGFLPCVRAAETAAPALPYLALPGPANPIPPGPVAPTWESVRANYHLPAWLQDDKFGIFIHWGAYTVAAHHNEWYPRHMYVTKDVIEWHREHFGPQDKFGYKDFIPLFKAEHYDPVAWAALFKKSGARYVVPVAEHHDGFAMYDSALTKWNAKQMGPHRDTGHNFYYELAVRFGFEDVAARIQDEYLAGRKNEAAALVPPALLQGTSLIGPESLVEERVEAMREAGVTTLNVTPLAGSHAERVRLIERVRDLAR